MIGRRSTTLALLCLAAAIAAPVAVNASQPDPVVSPEAVRPATPAFAPSLHEVLTVDVSRVPSFDLVLPSLLAVRIVRVDSAGHELLKIAAVRVAVPSPAARPSNRPVTLRAATNSFNLPARASALRESRAERTLERSS